MKCIKNDKTEEIQRVADEKARRLVNQGEWRFCAKQEWKEKKK